MSGGTASHPYGAWHGASEVLTPYRFTGQREESALGLYYYGARWYDPALGRFIQPDPLVPEPGNPQALNRYSYVYNNPVKLTDPGGHAPTIDAGAHLVENIWTGNILVRDIDGSALYRLIALASLGDGSATEQLALILDSTAGAGLVPGLGPVDVLLGRGSRTQFRGLRGRARGRWIRTRVP